MTNTTLLIGGTGKTGRRVAERLERLGVEVRVGSRSSATPFDWHDESTWGPALDGVRAAYITFYPDLGLPGAADKVGAFAELAAKSGAGQLVLLSGRGEELAQEAERRVQDAGTGWTIVTCAWFMQNFSEDFLVDAVRGGDITLPAGDVPEPFVDAEDIADVVAAALTDQRHQGRRYELTGPRALTFGDVAAELSRATGRTVRYTPITHERYRDVLREAGLPVELGDMFRHILDGRNVRTADGVREALGRPARGFAEYAARCAATGVWDPA
ncbi:NmrA family transcriptional regulator [Paractinoplanes deccanensis]|uniref:NmrA family transcriptional regulator n=1 Tax=Paractinoplanes deccanensis TaxID=113561 RepID=A0ABQ3Y2V3_9ACTN|nr:NmrA family NAD(P)-binding protein [Actinoplanes deccanensis]GID74323.1 NmrA family transcriptional regulator [Actinoplanes deccanensis]